MIGRMATRGRVLGALIDEPLAALELLTILRLRRPPILDDARLGRSQAFFPAVGLALGAILYGADRILNPALGAEISGWLLVACLALLSGGLHLDGLADSIDGLFGGRSKEQRLSIMRDTAVGAFGVCALIIVIGLKAASLSEIDDVLRFEALLLAPVLARWAAVVVIVVFPYARDAGLGKSFHASAAVRSTAFAAAFTLAAGYILLGPAGILAFAAVSLGAWGVGFLIARQIGGLTGDSYGAVVESMEAGVLVTFAAGFGE